MEEEGTQACLCINTCSTWHRLFARRDLPHCTGCSVTQCRSGHWWWSQSPPPTGAGTWVQLKEMANGESNVRKRRWPISVCSWYSYSCAKLVASCLSLLFALSSSLAAGQHGQEWYGAQLSVTTVLVSCLTCCNRGKELLLLLSPADEGAILPFLGSWGTRRDRECTARAAMAEVSPSPSAGSWISLAITQDFMLGIPGASQKALVTCR